MASQACTIGFKIGLIGGLVVLRRAGALSCWYSMTSEVCYKKSKTSVGRTSVIYRLTFRLPKIGISQILAYPVFSDQKIKILLRISRALGRFLPPSVDFLCGQSFFARHPIGGKSPVVEKKTVASLLRSITRIPWPNVGDFDGYRVAKLVEKRLWHRKPALGKH